MQFVYQPLTWAFLLVLAPLLIHLINLLRQRRVQWAAMEFLLQSHRKHRRWIWLKQLLLLLLRMLVVATVVAMLAGLVTPDQWSILGGQATHHFLVVDDSLSMSDRSNSGSAMDSAASSLNRIAKRLTEQATAQKATLLRYSRATLAPTSALAKPDLNANLVDADFQSLMEEQQRQLEATELALAPGPALEFVERLLADAPERRKVVYLLSDFRASQWRQSSLLRESLRRLRVQDAEVHLIRCVDSQHQNLAVVRIEPRPGALAAGVPLLVDVQVRNFGPAAAQQVQLRVAARSYPENAVVSAGQIVPEEQITTLVIDEIPPGQTAVRQTQLRFDRAGQHIVEARLTSDAVVADNRRSCLIELPAAIPVLLIDGDPQGREAYFLSSVFAPGRVATGIEPVARPPAYLRDAADDELARYAAIYLVNVDRLDSRAVRAVQRYVENGGGLAFFPGPLTDPGFLNQLYADERGLFPLPVQADKELARTTVEDVPDLQVNDHPIFRALVDEGGKNRPLTRGIRIQRYQPVDPAWNAGEDSTVEVLATLPDGAPLAVARRRGQGQVVAFLTTASPTWNNWARDPSYPVVILQLHGFLSAPRQPSSARVTGDRLVLQLEAAEYRRQVEFTAPRAVWSADSEPLALITKEPDAGAPEATLLTFTLGRDIVSDLRTGETDVGGVYVAKATTLEGQPRQRRFVVDAPIVESDLALLDAGELAEEFEDLRVQVHDADDLDYESAGQDGFAWSQLLAVLLIGLLLGEQAFAYSASYHPRRGAA